MKACCLASYRVFEDPASALVEDYQLLELELEVYPDSKGSDMSNMRMRWPTLTEAKSEYIPFSPGLGGPIKLTITTVIDIVDRRPTSSELIMLHVNKGAHEPQVAAMLLWMTQAPQYLVEELEYLNWFSHPLEKWKSRYSDILDKMRRQVTTPGRVYDLHGYNWMRKIFNITYRGTEEPDWDEEYALMRHRMPIRDLGWLRKITGKSIDAMLRDELHDIADSVVERMVSRNRIRGLQEWWDTRVLWMPTGSTTTKDYLRDLRDADHRLDSKDRPNKKISSQALNDDHIAQVLQTVPISLARRSKKSEAGWKARALYALDDDAFHVAAYASSDVEQNMDFEGMHARQAPEDVADWTAADLDTQAHECWLSLDYSNFNKEHRHIDLSLIDLAFTQAWCKAARMNKNAMVRAQCSYWLAQSHFCAFVSGPEGTERVFSGLYSGHRNTARDNTILHLAYSRIVKRIMKNMFGRGSMPRYTAMCGDDEDACFPSSIAAMWYLRLHDIIGWTLKPSKQLLSNRHHEYLQRSAFNRELPSKPLCTLLETIATGNWYKRHNMWYDSAIMSISDNCFELVRRGFPLVICQRLAKNILNASMVVYQNGNKRKLEWWKYRHGERIHPLWASTGMDICALPVTAPPAPKPHSNAPRHATQAYANRIAKMFSTVDGEKIGQYVDAVHADAYKALYSGHLAKVLLLQATDNWPERSSTTYIPLTVLDLTSLSNTRAMRLVLTDQRRKRRPTTTRDVYARLGIDPRLVEMLGGLERVWRFIAPEKQMDLQEPDDTVKSIGDMMHIDTSLASWCSIGLAEDSNFRKFFRAQ